MASKGPFCPIHEAIPLVNCIVIIDDKCNEHFIRPNWHVDIEQLRTATYRKYAQKSAYTEMQCWVCPRCAPMDE